MYRSALVWQLWIDVIDPLLRIGSPIQYQVSSETKCTNQTLRFFPFIVTMEVIVFFEHPLPVFLNPEEIDLELPIFH